MRLTALIPTFAFLSVGNVYLGISAVYLSPWMDVCESISLMNFFLLIRAYLAEANVDDNDAPLKSIGVGPSGEGYQKTGQSSSTAKPVSKTPPSAWVCATQPPFREHH